MAEKRGEAFVVRDNEGRALCRYCIKPVMDVLDHLAKCQPGMAIGILEDIYARADARHAALLNAASAQESTLRKAARSWRS